MAGAWRRPLDVEWAHALAPGAQILVVEAKSSSIADLMSAVNVARNTPGVSIVSMSWGGSEFRGETGQDAFFTTPIGHTGITFLAATGDDSASSGAQWPASSPGVVAVGGTTLAVAPNGATSEIAWSGSGGGVSRFETAPSFQAGLRTSGRRATPDVAADAGGAVAVFSTDPTTGQGSWTLVVGTSIATPIWAAILADADQAMAAAGEGTLNSGNGTAQAALYRSTSAGAFRDITAGSNGFSATTGFDMVTGQGSPVVTSLIPSLVGSGTSPASYPGLVPPKRSLAPKSGKVIGFHPIRHAAAPNGPAAKAPGEAVGAPPTQGNNNPSTPADPPSDDASDDDPPAVVPIAPPAGSNPVDPGTGSTGTGPAKPKGNDQGDLVMELWGFERPGLIDPGERGALRGERGA